LIFILIQIYNMAKHSRRHSRRQMGGENYTSATTYGMAVNGDTNAQYNRVFGTEYANVPGNTIIGAQGQNVTPVSQMPTAANLAAAQSGGKRRRHGGFLGEEALVPLAVLGPQQTYGRKKGGSVSACQSAGRRRRRGGFLGEVVNQAVVPMALLGMQQTYRRKRGGSVSASQSAGKTRRRGGFLGEVVNQAVVPMTLLGMQQTYGRKKGGSRHTRRHKKH